MYSLLDVGLSNAAAVILLAIVAFAVSRTWRHAPVVYAAWLLVVLKLITPPLVGIPGVAIHVPRPASAEAVVTDSTQAVQGVGVDGSLSAETSALLRTNGLSKVDDTVPRSRNSDTGLSPLSWWPSLARVVRNDWPKIVGVVWVLGTIISGAIVWIRLRAFGRVIRHTQPAGPELANRVRRLAESLGLKQSPDVRVFDSMSSPFVAPSRIGAVLLFPTAALDRLDQSQMDSVIVHELAHVRRRDHWMRWLYIVVQAIYWWHPVAWWACREMRRAEESCCDAWVLWKFPERAKQYARALVVILDSMLTPATSPTTCSAGGVHPLQRRLEMILEGRSVRFLSWKLRGAIALAGLVVLPVGSQSIGASAKPRVNASRGAEMTSPTVERADAEDQATSASHADDKSEGDKPKIAGTWTFVSATLDGQPLSSTRADKITFKGDSVSVRSRDRIHSGTFTLNPEANPKAIEMKLGEFVSTIQEAIYHLDGDELTLGYPNGAGPRPTTFSGKGAIVFALKRDRAAAQPTQPPSADEIAEEARLRSGDNLAQLAAAMLKYHEEHGCYPPAAIRAGDGTPLLSWRVRLLPYLGLADLYEQFRVDEPWDSPHNKPLAAKMPKIFLPDGVKTTEPNTTFYQVFVGKGTIFESGEKVSVQDVPDGTSCTILIAEAATPVVWTQPCDLHFEPDQPLPALGGVSTKGTSVALADSSPRFLSSRVDPRIIRILVTRGGGEILDDEELDR